MEKVLFFYRLDLQIYKKNIIIMKGKTRINFQVPSFKNKRNIYSWNEKIAKKIY